MIILRDVVRISGPEAASFLQGQVSQDIEVLAEGSSAWAFILEPQGKVDAWVRVTRVAADAFLLDVDAGFGDAVVARLDRFKLRTKADIECLGAAPIDLDEHAGEGDPLAAFGPVRPPGDATEPAAGWEDAWDAVRVRLGIPAMGRELTADTIPEEVGLVDVSVSFTKGCYTGQELVARIDSRGRNVPRRLRRVRAESALGPGTQLMAGGKVVGTVTSWAAGAGLAIVGRAVEPPAEVESSAGGMARIEALPPLR